MAEKYMADASEADSQEIEIERNPSSKSSDWIRKLSLPLTVISAAFVLSFLIHGSSLEFAIDFPLDVSSEIEGGIDDSIDWTIITFGGFFDAVSDALKVMLGKLRDFLLWVPWPIMMILVFVIGWKVASLNVAFISLVGLLILAMVNLWEPTMVTVAIMIVSVFMSVLVGLPTGVLAARSDRFEATIRPVLDTMQTMPSFVYLVPGIMLFGLGNVGAIFATVLYALPPCIRLTNLGIRQVDPSVVEAGQSFGSSEMQLLFKIQIPMAIPTIMAGINQTVMMALAMSTIAAMVGAGGLGIEVLRAMGQLREGEAVVAGCAIVILAVIIDRISQGYVEKRSN